MLIATCLKAIWRTDTALRLEGSGRGVLADGRHPTLNPADRSALGLALAIQAAAQSSTGGAGIHALTVGPPAWEGILRDALAHGAIEAHRLWNPDWAESRTLEVDGSAATTGFNARAAATVLRTLAPDLVLAGARSGDAGHESFGAALAALLGMAYAHRVVAAEGTGSGWRVTVELERGYTQRMELPSPAVLGVSPHVAGPAEASLPALLRSRTAPIRQATVEVGGAGPASTTVRAPVPRVKRYRVPDPSLSAEERIRSMVTIKQGSGGTVLGPEQSADQQAEAILALLKSKGYLPG